MFNYVYLCVCVHLYSLFTYFCHCAGFLSLYVYCKKYPYICGCMDTDIFYSVPKYVNRIPLATFLLCNFLSCGSLVYDDD